MQPLSTTTRRFEHGLPLLATLSPDVLLAAWARVANKEPLGLIALMRALGGPAEARTLRKLSAIWRAPDTTLMAAESDPKAMAQLERDASERPLGESFNDAMDFFISAAGQLGVSLGSSDPHAGGEMKNPETAGVSPSAG